MNIAHNENICQLCGKSIPLNEYMIGFTTICNTCWEEIDYWTNQQVLESSILSAIKEDEERTIEGKAIKEAIKTLNGWISYFTTDIHKITSFKRCVKRDDKLIVIEEYIVYHKITFHNKIPHVHIIYGQTIGTRIIQKFEEWDSNQKIVIEQYNKSIRDLLISKFPEFKEPIRKVCKDINYQLWNNKTII